MPLKYDIPLRAIDGNGTTQVVLNCPIGYRYHKLLLQEYYSGGTNTIAGAATNLTKIRVKLNNRVQRELTGTQLRDHNLFHGTIYDMVTGEVPNTSPGVGFPIYFAEPWRKDVVTQDALAWPTAGLASFQVELTFTNAATVTAWATVDEVAFDKPQMITKILPATITAATSADYTLADQSGYLTQISLSADGGGNVPTSVTLKKGSLLIYDDVTPSVNKAKLSHGGMYPVASGRTATIYDIVLDADDLITSALPLTELRDVMLTIKQSSASGSITALISRIGYPE